MTKTNKFREHIQIAIIETCDLWYIWSAWLWDMTWPKKDHDKVKYKDKDKDNDKDKDKEISRTHSKSDLRALWPLRHMIRVIMRHDLTKRNIRTKTNSKTKTITKTITFREHLQRAIIETCDLCNKDKYKDKDKDDDKDKYI